DGTKPTQAAPTARVAGLYSAHSPQAATPARCHLAGRPPLAPGTAPAPRGPSAPPPPRASRLTSRYRPRSVPRALRALPVVDGGVAAELGELVAGVDLAGGAGLGAHRQGLGEGAAAVEADPAQQLAVGDAGGGEEHVVAPDQVVDVEH